MGLDSIAQHGVARHQQDAARAQHDDDKIGQLEFSDNGAWVSGGTA